MESNTLTKTLTQISRFQLPASTLVLIQLLLGCNSAPLEKKSGPSWTLQSARTVDAGYIVYVSTAEDRLSDRALMKAEAVALQDVANECSFVPKGARIEDSYEEKVGLISKYSIKVGLSFQDCEAAQNATHPAEIHKLANLQSTEQIKRYQDLVAAENPGANQGNLIADNSNLSDASSPQKTNSDSIQSTSAFFIGRQQVAYLKQGLILAPYNAYPPGSPRTVQWIRNFNSVNQPVLAYARLNPSIRATPLSWSVISNRLSGVYNRGLAKQNSMHHQDSQGSRGSRRRSHRGFR